MRGVALAIYTQGKGTSSIAFRHHIPVLLPAVAAIYWAWAPAACALNPSKNITQYTRTVWTQQHGPPQDTVRTIVQTTDGYLWLGTDEGLARFDGHEFTIFNKYKGDLPSNSVAALAAGADGSLWIGTAEGLAHYRNGQFRTYTTQDGLPDNAVGALCLDHSGALWIVAGVSLSRFQAGRFANFSPGRALPIQAARAVYEDRSYTIWAAGFGGLARLVDGKFVLVAGRAAMAGDLVACLLADRRGNLWLGGDEGLSMRSPSGQISKYGIRDGLPDPFVRSLWEDHDGNLWVGTNGGLCRLENGRFAALESDEEGSEDWVRCIYEDREGNLWVGMNNGLNRFRDDIFIMYTKADGLPTDAPNTVYQDRRGRIWIGFHDSGLVLFGDRKRGTYFPRNGLPGDEVFSIREDHLGDLLVATREGLCRLHEGWFTTYVPKDPLGRRIVLDVLEDHRQRIWAAGANGLSELRGREFRTVIAAGSPTGGAIAVLAEGRDGSIWAGTFGQGLWRLKDDDRPRLYTKKDGLSSDQIRSLFQDEDGTLWIGTYGGGLDAFDGNRFTAFTSEEGLLSDNIAHITDDGSGSLWLSTTRGICRIAKKQLRNFAAGKVESLTPTNYGSEDGLRSTQCAPAYPNSRGGTRTSDGRLWFPTSRGLAVFDPRTPARRPFPVVAQVIEMTVDGDPIDLSRPARLPAGSGRIQIRYTGIHLSAPELVRYNYKLEGLDRDWIKAGSRRTTFYNSLRHGSYRFVVWAGTGGKMSGESSYSFEVLPHFYERAWFQCLAAALFFLAAWGAYQFRLRQVRGRYALVLGERARLAREIHDTLAQGFVGISSQLDAVAITMKEGAGRAREYLEVARKMAHHSLTEARRSVMDLRASVLDDQDLPAALQAGAQQWVAGSAVAVQVDISGPARKLPDEVEQHVLRIAQEAVINVTKHAAAKTVRIQLRMETGRLYLSIEDDGRGFEQQEAFSEAGGHFGLIGMRERAARIGGKMNVQSEQGHGTKVEVMVPLS
jgi:signal transduction histidine kinase/ligand-binding sensor domain-containing protein